jgi:dTDP-4-dehydrorhamnose reductase
MTMTAPVVPPLEMWGGVECTVNRVGGRWFDQLKRSGHDWRIEDLELFRSLGIRALRYPLLWERLAPHGIDRIDWSWSDRRLTRLRELHIRPIVGLVHHGSGPASTSLVDEGFARGLADFAAAVARRYPWVEDFTPINEPLTTARFSGLYGHWYPHGTDDRTFARILMAEARATTMAMRAIRAVTPGARLIQTEDCGGTFGTAQTAHQAAFERQRRWLTFDLLIGAVTPMHPLYGWLRRSGLSATDLFVLTEEPSPPDIVGLNYYLTSDRFLDEHLERHSSRSQGGNGRLRYADVEAVRARPEGIVGHEAHLIEAWQRYRLPVAITEVHLGCTREEQMRWLLEAWHGAAAARERGADVRAVTVWAMLGSFDWDSLVTRQSGVYEPGVFDIRAPSPRPTALAPLVRELASGREPSHPVLASRGWWRRAASGPAEGAPLLIVGDDGPVAPALAAACAARGLRFEVVAGPDVEQDAAVVEGFICRRAPWAVADARADHDADAAERDPDACHRTHVLNPAHLASVCGLRRIQFLSFSSDQVFDGLQARGYLEDDAVSPLNVLGASLVEAERRILAVCPQALVVRTGPLFGAVDDSGFITAGLNALGAGGEWHAPGDVTVSPTYVPHLVTTVLDLLIDGPCGIWHMANPGNMTWWELACEAAHLGGRPPDRIVRAQARAIWGPAQRPAWSVLSSAHAALMPPLDAALAAFFGDSNRSTQAALCA